MHKTHTYLNIDFIKPAIINFAAFIITDVNAVIGFVGGAASALYACLKVYDYFKENSKKK